MGNEMQTPTKSAKVGRKKADKYNPNAGITEETIVRNNQERFRAAFDAGHTKWVRKAKKFDRFYEGEQWENDDLQKLSSTGRPALTLNMILSTVNTLIGEQLERRIDVRFKPVSHADDDTAYTLNRLVTNILNVNNFDTCEETVFSDGLILDRGYYDVRLSFADNIMGEVVISAEDPYDIVIDPLAKSSDPSTWNEVFISRWLTTDEIAVRYGHKKAEQLRKIVASGVCADSDDIEFQSKTFGDDESYGNSYDQEDTARIKRIRVVERQYFVLTKQWAFIDLDSGDVRNVPSTMSLAEAKEQADKLQCGLAERECRRVRITTHAGPVLLGDDWSLYRTFTVVPFFPYFRRGRPFGVVRNLISPQELLNKTSSQELHIVNTTANSGWVVKSGSLVGSVDADDLATRGAETGLVLEYAGEQAPQKIQPNQIPTGIDRISQKAQQSIQNISAINPAMSGSNRADQSGKALEIQSARGQVQATVVLNNLKRARVLLCQKILELVQDYYTDTRVFSMAKDEFDVGNGEQNQEQFYINGVNAMGEILHDVTRGKYAVEIGYQPKGGTEHEIAFAEAMQLRQMGVAIPDYIVVQYSNLHKRGELAELLKRMQGFAEPTPEEQQLAAFRQESEINRISLELQELESKIAVAQAKAQRDQMEAQSLDGYNQAAIELEKLQTQKDLKQIELGARISLSAQSSVTQKSLADKRLLGQMAIESMRGAQKQQEKSAQPEKKAPAKSKKKEAKK